MAQDQPRLLRITLYPAAILAFAGIAGSLMVARASFAPSMWNVLWLFALGAIPVFAVVASGTSAVVWALQSRRRHLLFGAGDVAVAGFLAASLLTIGMTLGESVLSLLPHSGSGDEFRASLLSDMPPGLADEIDQMYVVAGSVLALPMRAIGFYISLVLAQAVGATIGYIVGAILCPRAGAGST